MPRQIIARLAARVRVLYIIGSTANQSGLFGSDATTEALLPWILVLHGKAGHDECVGFRAVGSLETHIDFFQSKENDLFLMKSVEQIFVLGHCILPNRHSYNRIRL